MKWTILMLTMGLSSACFALDADEIKALAKKPHSRDGLVEELKFFPNARGYEASLRIVTPGEDDVEIEDIVVDEKTVEGKYIVSVLNHPSMPEPLIMAVTYHKKTETYRKWVLLPDGEVGQSIGTVIPETRSISWVSSYEGQDLIFLGNEHHTEGKVRWRELTIKDGKVVSTQHGVAIKTK